jgi:hypothetical protein
VEHLVGEVLGEVVRDLVLPLEELAVQRHAERADPVPVLS